MANNSETGHATNVANFSKMVVICTSFGAAYNPSNPSIQLLQMNNTLTQAKDCMLALNTAQAAYMKSLSARTLILKPFGALVTRISNAVKATGANKQTKEQVMTLIRKLQGRRAKPKSTDEEIQAAQAEGKEINEISSSQMGINNRLENFNKLIQLLTSIPEYTPNEADLNVSALTAHYQDLYDKNMAVINTETPVNSLRITRNEILYKESSGLVDAANAAKMYIKSVFGATSPQYKQAGSLKFTRPR